MARLLVLLLIIVAVVWLLKSRDKAATPPEPESSSPQWSPSWLTAGGVLGGLILISRTFRVPLASLLTTLPFLIPAFRQQAEQQKPAQSQTAGMSREEARLILGVEANADKEAITDAHRRLIAKNHPDKGGSQYLAAKINQARDVLLA